MESGPCSRPQSQCRSDGGNLNDKVAILDKEHSTEIPFFPVAEYQGCPADVERILENHPMRRSDYSPCFNNCQHFVAAFLILLQVYANDEPNRSFKILDPSRMEQVLSVLGSEGLKLYNKPNMQLQFGAIRALSLSGWAAAGLIQAAGATVTYTVPAGGFFGLFGATTSVVAPAAYAPLAAAVAPVVTAATVGAGATYLWQRNQWKNRSAFNNPRYHGFPEGQQPPLTQDDYLQQEDIENKDRGGRPFQRILDRVPTQRILDNIPVERLLDSIPALENIPFPHGRPSQERSEPPPAPQRL
jgi:hypothetical protein